MAREGLSMRNVRQVRNLSRGQVADRSRAFPPQTRLHVAVLHRLETLATLNVGLNNIIGLRKALECTWADLFRPIDPSKPCLPPLSSSAAGLGKGSGRRRD